MTRADIVVKLRAQRDFADDWRTTLAEEAADNIERLRSDVAAYKKDFRSIAEALNDPRCDLTHTMAELVAELRAELAECRADAEKWRRMRSFARVLFERDGGHVLGACAIHIAVAAHDVGSDSARFEMDGVTDSDGRPCGDWLVTVARKGEGG